MVRKAIAPSRPAPPANAKTALGGSRSKNEDGYNQNPQDKIGRTFFFDRLRQPDNLHIEAKLHQLQLGFTALRPCLSTSLPLSGAIVSLL
jgi:hypothetical protein